METTIKSAARIDELKGSLRRYLNKNWRSDVKNGAGKWFFGFVTDRLSGSGMNSIWTENEELALADNGELGALLGLGTGQHVTSIMVSSNTRGLAATLWDSILTEVPGGNHPSAWLCKKGNHEKGGKLPIIRNDGARVLHHSFFN
jgi:hypothetical protein